MSSAPWYERGKDRGLNLDLEVSIRLAEIAKETAADPDERRTCLSDLGIALATLGERESETARLEEAVSAFRLALEEYSYERVPLQSEITHSNRRCWINRLASAISLSPGTLILRPRSSGCRVP